MLTSQSTTNSTAPYRPSMPTSCPQCGSDLSISKGYVWETILLVCPAHNVVWEARESNPLK